MSEVTKQYCDIKMKIGVDGRVERKLFCKAANKGLTLNYNSHHPRSTKNAIARNEIQRAIRCSTKEHEQSAIAVVRSKLSKNDYPESALKSPKPKKNKSPRSLIRSPLHFSIPFVSDKFNHGVQRLLDKHKIDARLCNPRGRTILQTTARSRPSQTKPCKSGKCGAPEICHRSNVVYQATCTLCGSSYIGMTTRALHTRALEHIAGARKHSLKSAFGEHYKTKHPKLFHGHIRLLLFSQSQTSYLLTCSSITSLSGQLAQITQFPMHDKYLSPASHGLQAANLKVLFRSHGRQAAEPSNDK